MEFRTLRRRTALIAAAALALPLAGCGSGHSVAGLNPTAQTPVTVQAGFIPVIDVAALYLGEKKGFFAGRGIDLKINTAQGGAALVPPVMTGEYQFGFSNIVSLLSARSEGLPLKVIASGSSSTAVAGKDVTMIRVPQNSPITSAADLAGKKVSVNTLNNLLQLLAEVSVTAAHGDADSVQFVELPFPDAVTALGNGNIDAMVTAEPFDTVAAGKSTRVIASPYLDLSASSLTTSAYFTSEQQLEQNPRLFATIKAAIDESLTYANTHTEETRAQLASFMKIDPAVARKVILPTFSPAIPRASIDTFVKAAKQFHLIGDDVSSTDVTYNDLVWSGSAG